MSDPSGIGFDQAIAIAAIGGAVPACITAFFGWLTTRSTARIVEAGIKENKEAMDGGLTKVIEKVETLSHAKGVEEGQLMKASDVAKVVTGLAEIKAAVTENGKPAP